jgi:sporulation protein YlmC with PRC-barrel domain
MIILTREGHEVGWVAAVILDAADRHASHLLLSRAGLAPDYRLVSIDLIEYVSQQVILLKINRETIASLPNRAREDFQ